MPRALKLRPRKLAGTYYNASFERKGIPCLNHAASEAGHLLMLNHSKQIKAVVEFGAKGQPMMKALAALLSLLLFASGAQAQSPKHKHELSEQCRKRAGEVFKKKETAALPELCAMGGPNLFASERYL